MKNFVNSFYDYNYSGVNDEERSDEEEVAIVIETDQSKSVSHAAANQAKLVSCTDSSSEEKEDSTLMLILTNQLTLSLKVP